MSQETQRTVEQIDGIEQKSVHLYFADPPEELSVVPPNVLLSQKAGFLFLRS